MYEAQLLMTLGKIPSLAEKHGRDLVPILLSFASTNESSKTSRTKLVAWLELFSKFVNPKALYASSDVYDFYMTLLPHPDRKLQELSLSCLLTYRPPTLTQYKDQLLLLFDDTKWRDEVTNLEIWKLEADERKEFVPVLIRIFFGMMLERKGHGSGGVDKRPALLSVLSSCSGDELELLIDLMVAPFLDQVNFDVSSDGVWVMGEMELKVSPKQQIGFLIFLADVLKNLGSLIVKAWPRLLAVTLTLAAHAQRQLQDQQEGDADDIEDGEDIENRPNSDILQKQLRVVRQLGLKRIAEFHRIPVDFDFNCYIGELFRTVISPRIPHLDRENTQAPSALFELLDVWSLRADTAKFLALYDNRALKKIYDCIVAKNVKPVVLLRIFSLVERLLDMSSENEDIANLLIKPYMMGLLDNLAAAVQTISEAGSIVDGIAQREVALLSRLSSFITDSTQATTLLSVFVPQLRKASKVISEKAKVDMLKVLRDLMPLVPCLTDEQDAIHLDTYDSLSYLFQLLRSRQGRIAACEAFTAMANAIKGFKPLADLLSSLNAFSAKHIEDIDFDRRLTAFATLNEDQYASLSAKDWKPLLHNMIYCIQDEGELSIRTNASLAMKRFLDSVASNDSSELKANFTRILLPGLKRCLRSKSDPIRTEVMNVFAHTVSKCNGLTTLQDMQVLLAGGDEEASFFNNIFHIQVHRRTRALRRFADFCDEPGFHSATLQEIFLPIVNGFISDRGDHHLVNEAISTLGRIAKHLSWSAYYTLVQQYLKLIQDNSSAERTYTRALVSVLDNFHFSLEEKLVEPPSTTDLVDNEVHKNRQTLGAPSNLSMKIHAVVNDKLLPTLLKHLEQKGELEDPNRTLIAVGIAKISLHLPEPSKSLNVSKLLTIISQIFRSKSQETRDLTREALCRIVVILGLNYLPQAIKELRDALHRGPHLHVLAFVTHALLVHVTSPEHLESFNKLDNSALDVAHVSAEVIFGQSGKDVTSEGFKTKMKEVRGSSSRGIDSFAILAKHTSPTAMSDLLLPIKAILQETESVKIMQSVDEILRRISIGVSTNANFKPEDLLLFCYTLISQNARFFQQPVTDPKKRGKKVHDEIVQLKRKLDGESSHYAHNSWR